MANLFFADLVREASHGTGTGDLTLAGALPGHRRFAETVPPGARFHYCIAGVSHPGEWETGEGEIVGSGSLERQPLASSAGGAAVDFSPGLKTVALTVAADWFAAQEEREIGIGDIDGLGAELDGKAPASHGHGISEVDGLGAELDGKAPDAHGHAIGDVEGLRAELDGKAAAAHGHGISEVVGLQAALSGKQPLDSELSAIAALASAADRLAYFTGPGAAALAVFTTLGRSLAGAGDAAAGRSTLGLGSIATQSAGAVAISGGTIAGLSSLSVSGSFTLAANSWLSSAEGAQRLYFENGLSNYYKCAGGGGHVFLNAAGGLLTTLSGDGTLTLTGNVDAGGIYKVDGIRVVSNRAVGWSAATGTAARTTFDSSSVSLAQLAQRVKALIDDLLAHGLIGA